MAMEMAIGLGLIGSTILLVGLVGLYTPVAFAASLVILGGLSFPELGRAAHEAVSLPRRITAAARGEGFLSVGVALAASAILLLSAVQALTPPADNDALMYHLQAPRLYLETGRLFLTPDIWQANGPMLAEMVYALGLAFGSDAFARLVNLTFAVLLTLATYGVAARDLGRRSGWLALAILLGIPILPIWGSLAGTDMAWALYSFLAVIALLRWSTAADRRWLLLGGLFTGFAVSSRYIGLGLALLLSGWVAVARRNDGWRSILQDLSSFVACAGAVAWLWFAKNLVWTGNPVYPFLFGGPDWNPERLAFLMTYLRSFGSGTSLANYLLLPINLFVRHADFGTSMTSIDVPSPFFLLALASPWAGLPVGWIALGLLTLLAMLLWAVGSQQIRFLLPLYPILTLLAVVTLRRIDSRFRRPGARVIVPGIALGGVAATLVYQLIFVTITRPFPVILGEETKNAFLERTLYDYSAIEYIEDELPLSARVALLWDGRGYYCDTRCIPDADLSRWPRLLREAGSVQGAMEMLRGLGISHLLVDLEELSIRLEEDPGGPYEVSLGQLAQALAPPFAREIFRTEKVVLYEILPPER